MAAIYVLTDPVNESLSRYKVGSHKGTLSELRSRYITPIPNLIIRYFIQIDNAKQIESYFKLTYENRRIINSNGNRSEWVTMPLDEIFGAISSLICRSKIVIENDTQIINFTETKDELNDLASKLQTCYVSYPQITVQNFNTFISPIVPAVFQNDELRIQELKTPCLAQAKHWGIKYKKNKGECQTAEEIELFQLTNKIKRRRARANKKSNQESTFQLEII